MTTLRRDRIAMMSSMLKKRWIKPIFYSLVTSQHKILRSPVLHNQMKD